MHPPGAAPAPSGPCAVPSPPRMGLPFPRERARVREALCYRLGSGAIRLFDEMPPVDPSPAWTMDGDKQTVVDSRASALALPSRWRTTGARWRMHDAMGFPQCQASPAWMSEAPFWWTGKADAEMCTRAAVFHGPGSTDHRCVVVDLGPCVLAADRNSKALEDANWREASSGGGGYGGRGAASAARVSAGVARPATSLPALLPTQEKPPQRPLHLQPPRKMLNAERKLRLSNADGISPVRLLLDKSSACRFVRLQTDEGIGPFKLLELTSSSSKAAESKWAAVLSEMLSGIVPMKLFHARSKVFRFSKLEKLTLASSPLKPLFLRLIIMRSVQLLRLDGSSPYMLLKSKSISCNLLMSGILPVKLFSPRSRMTRLLSLNICLPSSTPCKLLLEKERYSNELALKSSLGRVPLRLLWPALSTLSMEQLPSPEGTLPPIKLLLLALREIKFCIPFHVVDVNCPVNKLLEMLSTCRGHWTEVEDDSSCRSPLSWLKLTSRTTMLLEDTNSCGRPPYSELCCKPVTPSHLQQSVPSSCHDLARLESCESPARNSRRDVFSCPVQELAGMANNEARSTRETGRTGRILSANGVTRKGHKVEEGGGGCYFHILLIPSSLSHQKEKWSQGLDAITKSSLRF
ncbi:hypothetical protein U9M48_025674 [Paspalum notatum var. saurae]|uniref:Uncharacterized protein n=1 Tax=Paspalum notatum var. saurae TaxID=547442 RepID=A0AAQ3TVG6_PASNO